MHAGGAQGKAYSRAVQGHDAKVEEIHERAQQEEDQPAQRIDTAAREARRHQPHDHRHRRGNHVCAGLSASAHPRAGASRLEAAAVRMRSPVATDQPAAQDR